VKGCVVRSLLTLVLIWTAAFPAAAGEGGRPVVLVHGSFVGAWYWDPVAEGLRAMGHHVTAVDLTGDAGVADLATVTLQAQIGDVVAAIEAADAPVVLVAHSAGGRPATGAWDLARDRIAVVVFLEAVAPYGSGDLALPEEKGQRAALAQADPASVERGYLLPPPYLADRYPGRTLVPQSLAVLHGAVPLTQGPLPDTPGAYVLGADSIAPLFRQYAQRVAEERGWTVYEIGTGHDMVHDDADVVTRLIDHLARTLPDEGPGHAD
jgi:pimeloyl-ACP methyl ester carboxylesterase